MSLASTVERQINCTETCWLWTGYTNRDGYGFATVERKQWLVHRYVYTQLVGPIAAGLTLDHLCRVRACCNPAHLEPVTATENIARGTQGQFQLAKTHCPNGHAYAGENLSRHASGSRRCKACLRASNRRRAQNIAEQGAPAFLEKVNQ